MPPSETATPGRRGSVWSVASLLCSVAVCPPFCTLGIVFGIVALRQIRRAPGRSGRGLALAGTALGVVASAAWIGLGVWWHVNVRRPMLTGPREALVLGFAGDLAGFQSVFRTDPGVPGAAAEARGFIDGLRARYGAFVAMRPVPRGDAVAARDLDPVTLVIPYQIDFERAAMPAEARFDLTDGRGLPMVLKWRWLRVIDAKQGDLVYPSPILRPEGSEGGPDASDDREEAPIDASPGRRQG